MGDIREQEYSEWLEDALRFLLEFGPERILIYAKNGKGQNVTMKYHCESNEISEAITSLKQDLILDFIKLNKEFVKSILDLE